MCFRSVIMEAWGLDDHPVLDAFRKVLSSVPKNENSYYHLLLSPPHALPESAKTAPLDYLFVSYPKKPNKFILFNNKKKVIEFEDGIFKAKSGFKKWKTIPQLMENNCTSVEGISFTMRETLTDIYHPVPPSDLCVKIREIWSDCRKSTNFLERETRNPVLKDQMDRINKKLTTTDEVPPSEIDQYIAMMKNMVDTVATTVFQMQSVMDLPIAVKNQMNYMIFNVITAKPHFKLMMAYNTKYHEENIRAQQTIRHRQTVSCDMEKMEMAVGHLHNILHHITPCEAIACIVKFFDGVVAALAVSNAEVAADDILPGICMAMTKDLSFGSHVMSFFQYLAEIWPPTGLDERTSYILTTCAIAASHLAMGPQESRTEEHHASPSGPDCPAPDPSQQHQMETKTNETIGMLENLLDFL